MLFIEKLDLNYDILIGIQYSLRDYLYKLRIIRQAIKRIECSKNSECAEVSSGD